MQFSLNSDQIQSLQQKLPHLKLLALFGSRAKGTATQQSDWDLAILLDWVPSGWEELVLGDTLAQILNIPSDRVDLVNLTHCSPVLGYVVAKEGQVLYESEPNLFIHFQIKAWKQFADTAKLRRYQKEYIQAGLKRLKS